MRASAGTVATVATVASANGRNPLLGSSDDTHDTDDTENECRDWRRSGEPGTNWTEEQLQALVDEGEPSK